jgi:hypothetical protein
VTHNLNLTFSERWIGRGGHLRFPPKFLDVTPLDSCPWGWMKSEVCEANVNTIDELVARIMNSTALLKQEHKDDLRRATRIFVKKV